MTNFSKLLNNYIILSSFNSINNTDKLKLSINKHNILNQIENNIKNTQYDLTPYWDKIFDLKDIELIILLIDKYYYMIDKNIHIKLLELKDGNDIYFINIEPEYFEVVSKIMPKEIIHNFVQNNQGDLLLLIKDNPIYFYEIYDDIKDMFGYNMTNLIVDNFNINNLTIDYLLNYYRKIIFMYSDIFEKEKIIKEYISRIDDIEKIIDFDTFIFDVKKLLHKYNQSNEFLVKDIKLIFKKTWTYLDLDFYYSFINSGKWQIYNKDKVKFFVKYFRQIEGLQLDYVKWMIQNTKVFFDIHIHRLMKNKEYEITEKILKEYINTDRMKEKSCYYMALINIHKQSNIDIIMKYLLNAGNVEDAVVLRSRLFQEKYMNNGLSNDNTTINKDADTILYLMNMIKDLNK